ncbi:hypothetical protein IQ254_12765 [Nodosilinea sp. LEGE 07088]|uniref:hypothetical protein n=1 Tax=Nodosilinea sp. LEGE 07088 TaxID=2777968 RepID=UPI001882CFE7|nr:hypothetical protein [Nodosilinea sp. LEGE 07088]MBE9138050.1 hypothetical protein [Nodosilinea sp. LEGE 07088]
MTQTVFTQHLPPEAIHQLVGYLPDYIKEGLEQKASELDCSLEAVIELALASLLDDEAFSFEDCLLAHCLNQHQS